MASLGESAEVGAGDALAVYLEKDGLYFSTYDELTNTSEIGAKIPV